MNRTDQAKEPRKWEDINLNNSRVGWIDTYGNYRIEMPEHHVHIDERNFFSRYWHTDRLLKEKESRIDAFSKSITIPHIL